MFGPAGFFYVFRIYGLHWMLNVVTGPEDVASAVLIRSAGAWTGPGRLARHLDVTSALNGQSVSSRTMLWIEKSPKNVRYTIKTTPRIGVNYAGLFWARRKLRFVATLP